MSKEQKMSKDQNNEERTETNWGMSSYLIPDPEIILVIFIFAAVFVLMSMMPTLSKRSGAFRDALNERVETVLGGAVEVNVRLNDGLKEEFSRYTKKSYEVLEENITSDGSDITRFKGSLWVEKEKAEAEGYLDNLATDLASMGAYGKYKIYVTDSKIKDNHRTAMAVEIDRGKGPFTELVVER